MATQDQTDGFLEGVAWSTGNILLWVFCAGFSLGLLIGTLITLMVML
jgi:hypothetical protein